MTVYGARAAADAFGAWADVGISVDHLAGYPTRAAAEAAAITLFNSVPEGKYFRAGVLDYQRVVGADELPDFPGFLPAGRAVVEHYGDGAAAVAAMVAHLGYVRISTNFVLDDDLTIDAPVHFDDFASISGPHALTITGEIVAGPYWIFGDDLDLTLGHDADSGEPARVVRAEWFGAAATSEDEATDMAPRIQRAMDAVGNAREAIVELPFGNINIASAMSIPRATWLRGEMIRGTVLRVLADGFTMCASANILARVSDLNVEWWGAADTRVSPIFDFQHNECRIEDVRFAACEKGVRLKGQSCQARRLRGVYGQALSSASTAYLLAVDGSAADFDDIRAETSGTYGPTDLVKIGAGATGNIANVTGRNISTIGPSRCVGIYASAGNVSYPRLENMDQRNSGASIDAMIYMEPSGGYYIRSFDVSGGVANSNVAAAVHCKAITGGSIRGGVVGRVIAPAGGLTGTSGLLLETDGVGYIQDVAVAATNAFRDREFPVRYVGNLISNIRVEPAVFADRLPVATNFVYLADDAVTTIDLSRAVFSGLVRVSVAKVGALVPTTHGEYVVRAAASPSIEPVIEIGTSGYVATMTGTYGADGEIGVGVEVGAITIENRLGNAANVTITLESGQ